MFINDNYLNLKESYLFSDIARRVNEFSAKNPDAKVIRLGIGDVTRPLAPAPPPQSGVSTNFTIWA